MKPLFAPVLLSLVASPLSFTQITETRIPGGIPGFGVSVAIDADNLLIGSHHGEGRGSGHFYRRNGDEWTFVTTLMGGGDYNRFGTSADISGDIALIGDSDHGGGRFYSYLYNGTTWQLMGLTNGSVGGFANSLCIDGSSALVGCSYGNFNGANSGGAIAYTATAYGWRAEDTLLADDGAEDDEFGSDVSFDGDFAVVGAQMSDAAGNNSGAAYFFERIGTEWFQMTRVTGDVTGADQFGRSVSISGDYALVGAPFADTEHSHSGAAYVFRRVGSSWVREAKLVAGDRSIDDHFGISVSLRGDYAVIGAEDGDGLSANSGTAYIFKREGSSWNQVVELYAVDGWPSADFGASVDISDEYVAIGGTGHSVYLYSGYAGATASVAVSIDSMYHTVPPQGATFPYDVAFTNNTADTLTMDFWTKLVRPDGSSVEPFLGPKTPVLGPHAVINKSPIISVPANRDPGDYLLIAFLGTYPGEPVDTDTTGFTKLASGVAGERVAISPRLVTRLEGNHPNPFNPSTTFSYALATPGQVSLNVYNMLGQLVRSVVDEHQAEGYHEAVWDGTNETGAAVSSGIYVYRMMAGNHVETKRMVLMK